MATVPDLSGNNPIVDAHIQSHEEEEIALLTEIETNTTPA